MAAHVRHIGGQLQSGYEPDPDAYPTEDVRMVPVDQACYYGDTSRLQKLCMEGFPDSGSYQRPVERIGLRPRW